MSTFFNLSQYLGLHQNYAVTLMPDYHVEGETLFFCGYPERNLSMEQATTLRLCSSPSFMINYDDFLERKAPTTFLLSLAALGYVAIKPYGKVPNLTRPRILIISPHMDDAFLSLGGFISGYSASINFQIIDIFGNDPWCTYHERFRLQKDYLNTLRRREDEFSAWLCDCDIQIWGFVSSPNRGHQTWNGEYDPILDEDVKQKISEEIGSFINKNEFYAILWPLGVGGHTDHRLVNLIPRELVSKYSSKFAYYEDLPYSAFDFHWQTWPPLHLISSMTPFYVSIDASLNYKRHILDVYRSQLVPNEAHSICEYSKPRNMKTGIPGIDQKHLNSVISNSNAHERLWFPETFTADLQNLLREPLG